MANKVDDIPMHMRRVALDPVEELRVFRESENGVGRVDLADGAQAFLVTRYEDVREILADPARFSSHRPGSPHLSEREEREIRAGNLLGMDPPDHNHLRRMLTPEFTLRRMQAIEPYIASIVESHLDAMEKAGPPVDLITSFALPIPSLVTCELLGVPYADREAFQQRTATQLDLSLPVAERWESVRESRAYMGVLVDEARSAPGEDMLGMLVREHGDELDRDELIGVANLLLAAGHEPTANMLGLGALALLQHPEQLAVVRDEPDAVDRAVEELLRYLSVFPTSYPRITTTDVEVGGVHIPRGEMVLCSLPSANRDPRNGAADPETLDVSRRAFGHVAFGHGVHYCLGAPLGRLEMRVAFPALFRRFPTLHVAGEYEFRGLDFVYGLRELPVAW